MLKKPLKIIGQRVKFEIMYTILVITKMGSLITPIVQKTRMNYKRTMYYLKVLQTKGLVTKNKDLWITTERGHEYINVFENLQNYC